MKLRKLSATLCPLLLLASFCVHAQRRGLTTIHLAQGDVRLQIDGEREDSTWSNYYKAALDSLLHAYETYLGVPFHSGALSYYQDQPVEERWIIRVVGKEKVFLDGKWVGGYNNSSGIFGKDRGIFVEYGIASVSRPALLFHEVGHFWFYTNPWLNEGIASFLPIACANDRVLHLQQAELNSIWRHWGIHDGPNDADRPTESDFRKDGGNSFLLWYNKTFKIQYIIFTELGAEGYKKFVAAVAAHPATVTTNSDALSLLASVKKADWKNILSGWVFAGPYTKYTWDFFKGDSLTTLTTGFVH